MSLFNQQRYIEAEPLARSMTEKFPRAAFGWKILGETLTRMGRNADALAPMQKAAALSPNDAAAHYNLGNAFQSMKRPDEAEASYRRALKIRPDYAEAHCNLGVALQSMNRLDEALASYRHALRIKPDFVGVHINLGRIFQEQGRSDEAEASYRWVLRIKPDFAEAHNNLGIALMDMARLDEAETSFRRALQLKPDFAEAYNNLGLALREQGKLDEAVASYRRSLSLNPDYADAHGNLGGALRKQGKLDEALACFQRQARLAPENCLAQHHIASLAGNNTERAPSQYVEKVFDDYANKFDAHLLQVLKYETPEKLVALVARHLPPAAEKWSVLDLGCGTGLAGVAISPYARQLVGVDLSARMLEKARARNLYQRLERLDLLSMMQAEKASSYDVIIAADVFVYLGRLDEIVNEAKRLLCPGGVFAFSVEALGALPNSDAGSDIRQGYRLEITSRYSHSSGYITGLASANGFLPLEMVETQIRTESNKPVIGHLVLWKN